MPFVQTDARRLLYIHVPKTGGGTVEAWLGTIAPLRLYSVGLPTAMRCTPQHLRMSDIRSLLGDGFFDHALMTVRNPYDRIASEYRMQAVLGGRGFWNTFPRFSLWLETALAHAVRDPFHLDNHLRPQWEFTGSGVEVLKYEDGLHAVVERLAGLLDVPPPPTLPRIHDTSAADIAVDWDEVDRVRVHDFYRKDFEVFGYEA
jgi:hypothetical protein